jgi:flagellar basal body rod protein FlgB
MDIEATKLELMRLLLQTQKETVLAKIKTIFEEEGADWWDDMDQEEKEQLAIGLQQAESGNTVSLEEAMKRYDKWH